MDDSNTSNGDFFLRFLEKLTSLVSQTRNRSERVNSNSPETTRPYTDGEFGVIDAYKV